MGDNSGTVWGTPGNVGTSFGGALLGSLAVTQRPAANPAARAFAGKTVAFVQKQIKSNPELYNQTTVAYSQASMADITALRLQRTDLAISDQSLMQGSVIYLNNLPESAFPQLSLPVQTAAEANTSVHISYIGVNAATGQSNQRTNMYIPALAEHAGSIAEQQNVSASVERLTTYLPFARGPDRITLAERIDALSGLNPTMASTYGQLKSANVTLLVTGTGN